MWQYAIGEGPIIVEDNLTAELSALLKDERYEIVIHNSNFDRTVIRRCVGIDVPSNRIFDTMACAMAHSLPGSLGELCELLNVPMDKSKDKDGKQLIKLFCEPRKVRRSEIPMEGVRGPDGMLGYIRANKETHPAEWERFRNYGRLDIAAMREVYKLLPRWNFKGFERELWELDQQINDRGVFIDLDLAHAAIRATDRAQKEYAAETLSKTDGEVTSTNRRDKVLEYLLKAFDLTLPDLSKATVLKALETSGTPQAALDLLAIRLDASKTSTSKYKRLLKSVCGDGRLRGLLQFCGAARTGRWAGRLFQPQNLPRPSVHGADLDNGISDLKSDSIGLISCDHTVMEIASSALRGVIVAPEGAKLVIADLSNIEGRVLAWLAGESWKVKAFRDFDKGLGHDLYNLTYAKAFGVPVESVTDDLRQIGKVMELAFGYQGGVGAWITFASAYGIDLEEMARSAFSSLPGDIVQEARKFLIWFKEQGKKTYGLSDTAFIVCDSFKRLWRYEHDNVATYWKNLETTCIAAVNKPGSTHIIGHHKIRVDGAWLRIGLPSGRCLCYLQPRLEDGKLSYAGVNQYSRKWGRIKTYGGKLAENITQACARDVLAYGMVNANKQGYDISLTVHDEIIAVVPDTSEFSEQGLCKAMTSMPVWAIDLPLAAKGKEMYRYAK